MGNRNWTAERDQESAANEKVEQGLLDPKQNRKLRSAENKEGKTKGSNLEHEQHFHRNLNELIALNHIVPSIPYLIIGTQSLNLGSLILI
jgi:hypothetical protein